MKLCYRFRFYPTLEQEQKLSRIFGATRFVYNWALKLRTDSYRAGQTINYHTSSAALTILKKKPGHEWLKEISSVPTQQALRHLQSAFKNYFEKRSAYPRFKKKHGKQSIEYTRSAFKWNTNTQRLTVSQLGSLQVRISRRFKSNPTTLTITKSPSGRYFVTLVLNEPKTDLPKTGQTVGVDLGVNRLATLSTGEYIPNTKTLGKYLCKLAHEQRTLSRRVRGSCRYERQRIKVARLHEKIANTRQDYLHKFTTDLVRRFDVICIEDLNVRGMIQNHHLARSLSDASLGMVRMLLEYKCAWYGRDLKKVDRFFPSSKQCWVCGHILESLHLSVRSWMCPNCHTLHDRDENASQNILAAGHAVSARGGRIRREAESLSASPSEARTTHFARESGA